MFTIIASIIIAYLIIELAPLLVGYIGLRLAFNRLEKSDRDFQRISTHKPGKPQATRPHFPYRSQ